MALLSADSFNRANGAIGSTDGAGSLDPQAWTNSQGTCQISSNQLVATVFASGINANPTLALGTADVDISITVVTINAGCGICFRYLDGNNFWFLYNTSSNSTQLWKRVAGSGTQVGSSIAGAANGDILRVVAKGNSIIVYRNGIEVLVASDSFNSTQTRHGLYYSSSSSGVLDSFSASNAAAYLSADSFNRTANTSAVGSTDGAGTKDPATWTTAVGTCGIISNQAYASAVPGLATVDLATGDVDISLSVPALGTGTVNEGICFRFSNSTNYWLWECDLTSNRIRLYKVVSGTPTQVGTDQAGTAIGDVLRVVASGTGITVYRNGTLKITTTDSFNQTATQHGYYTETTTARFDSFFAVASPPPVTTVTGTQAAETDSGTSGSLTATAVFAGGVAAETDTGRGSTVDIETILGGRAVEQDVARAGNVPHPIADTCVRKVWLELGALTVDCHNEAAGYFVTSFDPGSPDVRAVVNNRPDADGIDDVTRYMGGRVVSVDIVAIKTAGAIIDDVAASFGPFMVPSVRPELHYVLDRPGLPERVLIVRASKYAFKVDDDFSRQIGLQFVAADPVARDPATVSAIAWAGSSTIAGRTYDLTYDRVYPAGGTALATPAHMVPAGDVPVRPLLKIWGPATGATVTFAGTGGDGLVAFVDSYTIPAGHYVAVDCDQRTAYLDGHTGQSVLAFLDWAQMTTAGWPIMAPHVETIMSYAAGSTTDATQVIASYNDGYLA